MTRKNIKFLATVMVVGLVSLVLVSSLVGHKESVVGKDLAEVLWLAREQNDYATAQKIYRSMKVHGVENDNSNLEATIDPELMVKQEIARLEKLLDKYPSYPPLLLQLQKLYATAGMAEKADEYAKELRRLDVR